MHDLSRRALLVSLAAASGARVLAPAAAQTGAPASRGRGPGAVRLPGRRQTGARPRRRAVRRLDSRSARRPGEPRFRRLARHSLQIRQAAAGPGRGQFPPRVVSSWASLQAPGGRQRAARRHPGADPLRHQSLRLRPHQGRRRPADQSRLRRLSAALSAQRAARLGRGDRVSRRELFPLSRPRPALRPVGAGSGDQRRSRPQGGVPVLSRILDRDAGRRGGAHRHLCAARQRIRRPALSASISLRARKA